MMEDLEKMTLSKDLIETATTRDAVPVEQVGMSEHEDAIAAVVCNLYDITIAKFDGEWVVHWDSSDRQKVKECLKRSFVLDLLLENHDNLCYEPDIYFLACLTGWVKKFNLAVEVDID
tara:strand:- start:69 stop:422 length:354 start_codon:yes stop_codon:yes gene_type:complete